jgi:RND family efflux transporter MFP subunit
MSQPGTSPDNKDSGVKSALLNELKIDRKAPVESSGRSLRWLLSASVLLGIGFAGWFFTFPPDSPGLMVNTALARSAASVDSGSSVLDATGYVVARRQATVSSKTTGKVVEVLIEEGMLVEEGQLLAKLDDSIPQAQLALEESRLEAARAGMEELRVALKQAQLDLQRTQGLADRKLASQADLDRDQLDVEALQAQLTRVSKEIIVAQRNLQVQQQLLDDMQIRAPFTGVVIAKAAQPGEMISPVSAGGGFTRTGICTIVDMASLEVEVDVNEAYINRVYPGQPVSVTLNAYPDYQFQAEVIAIIPAADRNKATVRVRVALVERDERVLPDMGVRVAFLDDQSTAAQPAAESGGVLIPGDSVARDDQGEFVFVVTGDRADRRAVITGARQGNRISVTQGLVSGERIVANLSDELLASLSTTDRVSVVN